MMRFSSKPFRALAASLPVLLGTFGLAARTGVDSPECQALYPGGPLQVNLTCVDPLYAFPVIDTETDETSPSPHRRVVGHFDKTDIKFSIYLPPVDRWSGRFFQIVYPLQSHEADDWEMGFALDEQAYFVQATGAAGYRGDAALAKFSRDVAREYYKASDAEPIHGYVYGGSGGSFVTVGAIENTHGVWSGAVPIVQAVPVSNPNGLTVRAFAAFVCEPKAKELADVMGPGGSGDPYSVLDPVQQDAFREAAQFGIPPRTWQNFEAVSKIENLGLMSSSVEAMDPAYLEDFWTKPGYAGTAESALGDLMRASRIVRNATVVDVVAGDQQELTDIHLHLDLDFRLFGLFYVDILNDAGENAASFIGMFNESTGALSLVAGQVAAPENATQTWSHVHIDNSPYLALLTLHRHQVPERSGFSGFDQFRDSAGKPLYEQRPLDIAKAISVSNTGGGNFTGKITGKVIAINNLLDAESPPLLADWYRHQVAGALGNEDSYRLWFNDNADHYMGPIEPGKEHYLVDFTPMYQQALRDVSAWAEYGREPSGSTGYTIDEGVVAVPDNAAERKGIQPIVTLGHKGSQRIEVRAGELVTLEGDVELPEGVGPIVSVAWDSRGAGKFTDVPSETGNSTMTFRKSFRYCKPGTYFPGIRVTTHPDGDVDSPYLRVANLGRARVVVH